MNKLYLACVAIVGLINLLPVIGVLGGERLAQAYGIEVAGNDLEILLRHRALLFGIIGAFVLVSLFLPQFQLPALALAGVSMLGFIAILLLVGDYNPALHRIMLVDIVGLLSLLAAVLIRWLSPH